MDACIDIVLFVNANDFSAEEHLAMVCVLQE